MPNALPHRRAASPQLRHAAAPFLTLAIAVALAWPAAAVAEAPAAVTTSAAASPAAAIDAALTAEFKSGEPGAAVIVMKDGKPLFRKAYGMANIEKGVALEPQMVFRIGSLTKQFTAVAILMLAEQGKLSVSDDISKRLPDFPTQGKKITIEHLLTHTSGIANYTDPPEYMGNMHKDRTVSEMIDTFRNAPLQFEPGERFAYSNSGYFLLGAIIEKVSGMSYADFVARNIFEPLGMKDTAYEGYERSTARRVEGYGRAPTGGYVVARPVSMTQPFAAGSFMSTVDDLARWDAAITAGKLLKAESWKKAFTPYTLNNGQKSIYAYGWMVRKFRGSDVIEHTGGINGFVTYAMRLPADRVYVAVLMNALGREASPTYLAQKAAAIAVGKPFPELKAIKLDNKTLDQYEGTYKVDDKTNRIVMRVNDQLMVQRGQTRAALQPYAENEFFIANSFTRFKFVKDASGKVVQLVASPNGDGEEINPRTGDKPAERKSVAVSAQAFDTLVGEYQLAPGFIMTVSRDGTRFFTQATGQQPIEIFAESETRFFPRVIEATLQFVKDADGKVTEFVLTQNGRDMRAKKIK